MSWSISLIFAASNKLTQPVFLKRQVVTKKKTATTTMAETTQWGWQPQLHNHHHHHTQHQKFSSMMSSTSQRHNDDQRAQQWPNNRTYTSQWPNNGQRGQWPPSNQTHTTQRPDLHHPSITHTRHGQCVPAIDNLHHPLRGCPILCDLKITMSMHSTNSFFIIFRYLNNQRSPSLSNESCKLFFTMEGLQVVSIATHLFQEGHSTALRCIASTGYAT